MYRAFTRTAWSTWSAIIATCAHWLPPLSRAVEGQVSDTLSDEGADEWARTVGERAALRDWCNPQTAMTSLLLTISAQRRGLALRRLLQIVPLRVALTRLPLILHPFLVEAMIDSSGSLSSPEDADIVQAFMDIILNLSYIWHRPL